MKIINSINIKSKLGILFLILCISIAVLGYKSISISEHNKETLKVVHSKSQTVLSLQDRIITPLYSLRELTQTLVMAPNKQIREEIQRQINSILKNLETQFNYLEKNGNKKNRNPNRKIKTKYNDEILPDNKK